MTIQAYVRRPAVTLAPDASCLEAARLMREEGVGSVVVAERERPLGVVTDRDLATRVMAQGDDPAALAVADVMSADPIFVSAERSVEQVVAAMRDLGVRRMPIVDARGLLVGVVSLDDLLLGLVEQLGGLADAIRKELAPYG